MARSAGFSILSRRNVDNFDISPEEEYNRRTSPKTGVRRSIVDGRKIDLVHPESVLDLKDIADRMFWAGYAKELCQVYSSVRHDILNECISVLGFERMSIEEVQRTEWKALDEKMKKWILAIQVLVRVLLPEEKSLCEKICAASKVLQEECFTRAAKGCILQILSFGDAISISLRSAEKLFRTLDMYEALVRIIPDLRTLFSADANDRVCIEAEAILKRLGNSIRGTFTEFINAVQRDSSRKLLQGGDVHPLTRYVMNYVKLLVDYNVSLDLLLGVEELPEQDMVGDDQLEREMGPLAQRLLLLLSFLESNVEQKSKNYEDGGLQCMFLMNNILYIIHKVKDSELLGVLGDHWVRKRRGQVKQYATNYLRASWTKILSNLKDDGLGGSSVANFQSASKVAIKEKFKNFNLGFEEIYRNQTTWKVSDPQLREELRISILEKVIPAYRAFFGRFNSQLDGNRNAAKYVKYTPEELENYVSELFEGLPGLSNHPWRKLSFHHTLSLKI
ncbi:hypothetical protein HPP92_008089 [Vanilla planifolia]|uniref:Exocyst subunit Exo70 family protein n=1 Tax=Vanilla planifolia TaxID=51239 RepID=A0A835V9C5_VANPL|nr:hypothetical protein HPP92_008089 [Vanilla planifolia]